jgi:hypothetical protein
MDAAELSYRGRTVSPADVAFIRDLIRTRPEASRRSLSQELCEAWEWVQPNGALRDAVCRGLLLELHRGGLIELPAPRWRAQRPAVRQRRPAAVEVDETPLRCELRELEALDVRQVRRSVEEPLVDGLLDAHHYLGFTRPVGEHLKYLVLAGERPVACFVWSSAARHLGPRDRYIGWSAATRRRNMRLVAYNSRFLILPWVEVPQLASHLLGRMARMLPGEWTKSYGHPVWFAETFVDPTRFCGTCYRAANWVWLGRTTGRGKDDQTNRPNRSRKHVLGLPLHRCFRRLLSST